MNNYKVSDCNKRFISITCDMEFQLFDSSKMFVKIFLLFLERRYSYLKHSRLSVVAFLNELPTTKHDLSSFKIDVSLALVSCQTYRLNNDFLYCELVGRYSCCNVIFVTCLVRYNLIRYLFIVTNVNIYTQF